MNRMGDLAAMPGTADWMLPQSNGPLPGDFEDRWNVAPPPTQSIDAAYQQAGVPRVGDYDNPSAYVHPYGYWQGVDKGMREAEKRNAEISAIDRQYRAMGGRAGAPGEMIHGMQSTARDFLMPSTPLDFAMMTPGGLAAKSIAWGLGGALGSDEAQADMGSKAAKALARAQRMGGLAEGAGMPSPTMLSREGPALDFWRHADTKAQPFASPEAINRAAQESAQGITQPELLRLYGELGLTGRTPSELVQPSLAASHPPGARQAAIDLKLADLATLDKLPPKVRAAYYSGGSLPKDVMLPSREAAREATEAFAPTKKEVKRAEEVFDEGVRAGNKPTIFDLSPETLRKVPDVPQFNLPRVAPEATERLAGVGRGGVQRLEKAAANAPSENWGWYNLMQARDLFHSMHGPKKGEQAWNAWLDGVAGTSMVNPIDNNIRSSTWYLQQVLQGKPLPETLQLIDPKSGDPKRLLVGGPPPGYGAKSQIQHADRVNEYMTNTYDPVSNPKPISYRYNLSGNWMPRTVDTHDIRNMVGMPRATEVFGPNEASLLPKEYSYLEGVGQRAATRAGSPQAAQQAAVWVGGGTPWAGQAGPKGGYTGLKSYPAPLMEVINRRAQVTAQVRGISPEQAIEEAFSGKRPLLGVAGAAGAGTALGAGAMGETARQDVY